MSQSNWISLGPATDMVFSVDDPVTRQLAQSALFELESVIGHTDFYPSSPFDCMFYARACIALFSAHQVLRAARAQASFDCSHPALDAGLFVNEASAREYCSNRQLPGYVRAVLHQALEAAVSVLNTGYLPLSPFDLNCYLILVARAISVEHFF